MDDDDDMPRFGPKLFCVESGFATDEPRMGRTATDGHWPHDAAEPTSSVGSASSSPSRLNGIRYVKVPELRGAFDDGVVNIGRPHCSPVTGRGAARHNRIWTSVSLVVGLALSIPAFVAAIGGGRRFRTNSVSVTARNLAQGDQVNAAAATAMTIARPWTDVFSVVRDVRNWPRVMTGLQAVEPLGGDRWQFKFADGALTADVKVSTAPGIGNVSWTSGDASVVQTKGSIVVKDTRLGEGAEVVFTAAWRPRGGTIGQAFVSLFSEKRARREIGRLKTLVEGGKFDTARNPQQQL